MGERSEYFFAELDDAFSHGKNEISSLEQALGAYREVFHTKQQDRQCDMVSSDTASNNARAEIPPCRWHGQCPNENEIYCHSEGFMCYRAAAARSPIA